MNEMKNCNYLCCDACPKTEPSVRDAVIKGWQTRDGVWLCEPCLTGKEESVVFDDSNDTLLYDDDYWVPDCGWC